MKKVIKNLTALSLFLISGFSFADDTALYVGIASYDMTPPIGTPLGGAGSIIRRAKLLVDWLDTEPYANMFKPSIGVLDPIRSKAMVLKNNKRTLVFISLDLIGITNDVFDMLNKKLKDQGYDDVVISATHTHSGPGALSKSWVWQVMVMDSFNQVVYDTIINGILKSVDKAYANLEPAQLYTTTFDAKEIQSNRRGKPGHTDGTANVLLAKSPGGRWLGGLVNFGVHGMGLDFDNLLFSADVSGGIERHMEKVLIADSGIAKMPTMLFMNGAEADVTPARGHKDGIEWSGSVMAEKFKAVLPLARKIEPDWDVQSIRTKLPKARLNIGRCGNVYIKKKPLELNIKINPKALPRVASLWQLRIDDIFIMSFPGEPTTDVGFAAKALAAKYGHKDAWVFGLTNGYMAYFLTPEEYDEGGYEPCAMMHGKKTAAQLLGAHEDLLDSKITRMQ